MRVVAAGREGGAVTAVVERGFGFAEGVHVEAVGVEVGGQIVLGALLSLTPGAPTRLQENLRRAARVAYTEMYAAGGALVCARRRFFIASVTKGCLLFVVRCLSRCLFRLSPRTRLPIRWTKNH